MSSHTQSQESLAVIGSPNEKDAASGMPERPKSVHENMVWYQPEQM